MYLFNNIKTNCCGCKVCASICPKGCITFETDQESFVYPKRDLSKCIECHLCVDVCPMQTKVKRNVPITQMVGIHKNKDVLYHSSSGGAFTAISEQLLSLNYNIYGVKLDDDLKCIYSKANSFDSFKSFRKSKYIQAETKGVYEQVSKDLLSGESVYFTGVPCQIAALRLFLNKKKVSSDRLITTDILCHGVVSQGLFDSYIDELSKNADSKVTGYTFRNKKSVNGTVNSRTVEVQYANGDVAYYDMNNTGYLLGYHTRLFYRPSCYHCPFANTKRTGDLTLADAWGIEKRYPDFDSLSGVSLIMANTEIGSKLLYTIKKDCMDLRDIELDWAVSGNDTLREPTHINPG